MPIEGEAGVGYRMRPGFDLPPLMFNHAEAQALVAAVRIAKPRLDTAFAQVAPLARAAQQHDASTCQRHLSRQR